MKVLRVELRFFAALREAFGEGLVREVAPGTTAAVLWKAVSADRPGLRRLPVRFAVRDRYVPADYVLRRGDELAVFPPVSGGA